MTPAETTATSWRDHLPIHPACNLIPKMSVEELTTLAEDIKRSGGLRPEIGRVVVWKRQQNSAPELLDARSRLDGLEAAGMTVRVEQVGTEADPHVRLWYRESDRHVWFPIETVELRGDRPGGDPYEFVNSANISRRHLTAEVKRQTTAKLLKATPEKSNASIAKQAKVDDKTVAKVRRDLRGNLGNSEVGKDHGGGRQIAQAADADQKAAGSHHSHSALRAVADTSWCIPKFTAPRSATTSARPAPPRSRGWKRVARRCRTRTACRGSGSSNSRARSKRPRRRAGAGSLPGSRCTRTPSGASTATRTPPVAVRALLEVEPLSGTIWEPACGSGSIVTTLRAAGHRVVATDIESYGCPNSLGGVDFLKQTTAPEGAQTILTNPPFKDASKFIHSALFLVPRVIMLLRLVFLEGERRSEILEGGQLARVYVFRNRLPMMHRANWDGPKIDSGAVAFAWFIWEWHHRGPTELRRISWKPDAAETPLPPDDGDDLDDIRGSP